MSFQKHTLKQLVTTAHNFRAPSVSTESSIFDFLSSLDCPRALSVWLLYSGNEHKQLVDLECDPGVYSTPYAFKLAFAATSLLSKAVFLNTGIDKKRVALDKFAQYEQLCKGTNHRFRNLALDELYNSSNSSLLFAMTRKIARILGDFDPEEWFRDADWGPGVTTLLKGEHVSASNKFHSESGITRDLYDLVGDIFPVAYPLWYAHMAGHNFSRNCAFSFEVGNSLSAVPKNSKTDRIIAIEPGLNLFLQKGLGTMIRRRLQRAGIDLQDQRHNQRLARLGSLTGHLATVDFSSASDSISTEVIRAVLPPVWFSVLDASRSKLGVSKDGSITRWEKFSSMGNGFTFELESLIFFAAAQCVNDALGIQSEVSVYGDDVIIDVQSYETFRAFSTFLGFRVNERKSFYSPLLFRESCGVYYFRGLDCKPIFLKERLSNVESFYKLANSIRMFAHRNHSHYGCDRSFLNCYQRLVERIPHALRCRVPLGLGDAGLISNFDEACPPRAGTRKGFEGFEGFLPVALVHVAVKQPFEGVGLLLDRIRRSSDQAYGSNYTLRGRTKIRFQSILVQQWYNLGDWW